MPSEVLTSAGRSRKLGVLNPSRIPRGTQAETCHINCLSTIPRCPTPASRCSSQPIWIRSGTESSNPPRPPRRLWATLSLSADRPAEAQELRHFWRAAVHLGLAPEARKLSLMAGFLRGCSPGPFGTQSKIPRQIRALGRLAAVGGFELPFGRPMSWVKPSRSPVTATGHRWRHSQPGLAGSTRGLAATFAEH
jgi:hypothetical protein